jgi:G3E family GTPase
VNGPHFVVLTGFLGSGKTTLLRDYLAGPEAADTAVIVNEAGEVGLDGAILRETAGVPMAMLSNGCVCCQMGNDLQTTVDALLWADRPDATGPLRRIVLETSGLSKPGPVLRQLAGLAEHRMRVSVVATYDAVRGTQVAEFAEAAAQWAAAHRIVVTKADTVSTQRLAEAQHEAAGLNPLAEIVADADRARTVAAAFGPLVVAAMPTPPDLADADHPRIAVRLARPTGPLAYDDLATWLDNLAGALGDRLLRLKGLVRIVGETRPFLVQSVGTLFAPPRPFGTMEAAQSFVVVIARDLASGELDAVPPAGLFRISARERPLRAEAV